MGFGADGKVGKGNWADPTGTIQKSGASKWLDPLGFTKVDNSESAADRAARLEEERQARIAQNIGQINKIYDDPRREKDIGDFLSATRGYYRQDLDKQKATADRGLKFAMARNGQTGGSVSVDASRNLGQDYQRGVLSADRLAQKAAADIRSADQASRMNLIAMAQSGSDMTSGASQAANMLANNLQVGQSQRSADSLGDVFSGIGTITKNSRDQAETRRANRDFYSLLYSPGFGYGNGGR